MSPLWTPTALTADVVALTGAGPSAYAGLSDGRVLRLEADGGWATVGRADDVPRALLALPGGLLLATDRGLHRLADGRLTRADRLPEAVAALAAEGDVALAATLGHGVFRSVDGGGTWDPSNDGLPFRGAGLVASGLAAAAGRILVAHGLGVSLSRDAGLHWEASGAGLPLQHGPLTIASSRGWTYAETGGRLFRFDSDGWVERGGPTVALLGADARALYGVDPGKRLLWRSAVPGADWAPFGDGLPDGPVAVAAAATWRLAALASGALWCRPAAEPPATSARPVLAPLPPFWSGGSAEVGFHLPAPGAVLLTLVGPDGEEVARLADRPFEAGAHRLPLSTDGLPAGLYRCRLAVGTFETSRALAVLP